MCGSEYASGVIPFQRIFTEAIHRISQISDIGGVVSNIASQVGDISGVGCHVIVSGFQLRTVNRIGTGLRQLTRRNVGDFVGGFGAVCSSEYASGVIPFQRIFTEAIHRISQISDIGGVVSNIASQVGDISGVGCHVIVSGF